MPGSAPSSRACAWRLATPDNSNRSPHSATSSARPSLGSSATTDPSRALANASAYLDLVSRTVIGWLWLRQATVASRALSSARSAPEDAFYRGKLQAARYWFGWELPRTEQLATLLERGDTTPFDMQDAWF